MVENGHDFFQIINNCGAKLRFLRDEAGFGCVNFYLNNVNIGTLELFKSRRGAFTGKKPPYYVISPWRHRITGCKADGENGLLISGESGYYIIEIKACLAPGACACTFNYLVKEKHPFADVADKPHIEICFNPDGSKLDFVQYAFQAPVTALYQEPMEVTPPREFAPFMFSVRKKENDKFACGAGYTLDQEYTRGRIRYEETGRGGMFTLYPAGDIPISGKACKFSFILSFGNSQGECIHAYRKACGYKLETPFVRTVKESEDLFMKVYREGKAYIPGKGYRQQLAFATGEPAKGDVAAGAYGKFIPICANIGLAHNLYKWWLLHPEDTWARGNAFEMADFFIQKQSGHGGAPNLFLDGEDRCLTYVEYVRECRIREGRTTHPYPDGVCKYTTHMMSMAVYYLYRLYLARKEAEGADCEAWREAAIRAMDYLAGNVGPDGMVGRNYTDEGEFDDLCADVWLLIALDYMHQKTGNTRYLAARDRMEAWVEKNFAGINHWYNWSADGGFWHGEDIPPINHDAFEIPTYATYCAMRYINTGDAAYLTKVRDNLEYLWLCMIPVQYPGFSHITKGLVKEQDTYSTFDVPFNTTRLFDCLPHLTVLSGDRFYMDFYRFLMQLQLAYQAVEQKFPAFYIGLDWEKDDVLGEEEVAYISEFAGVIWLDSINSSYCYRYVGGENFSIGLDYDADFIPKIKNSGIDAVFSTCKVTDCAVDGNRLKFSLDGEVGKVYSIGCKFAGKNVFSTTIVLTQNKIAELSF